MLTWIQNEFDWVWFWSNETDSREENRVQKYTRFERGQTDLKPFKSSQKSKGGQGD